MKDIQVNTNKLVIQLMNQEEDLKDEEVILTLKKRNIQKRTY
jgi:riboflavin synthase